MNKAAFAGRYAALTAKFEVQRSEETALNRAIAENLAKMKL
ncbi:MAG: hypothetical protein WC736_02885 [Gallionella sp.]|jgi:hypothetical protein